MKKTLFSCQDSWILSLVNKFKFSDFKKSEYDDIRKVPKLNKRKLISITVHHGQIEQKLFHSKHNLKEMFVCCNFMWKKYTDIINFSILQV